MDQCHRAGALEVGVTSPSAFCWNSRVWCPEGEDAEARYEKVSVQLIPDSLLPSVLQVPGSSGKSMSAELYPAYLAREGEASMSFLSWVRVYELHKSGLRRPSSIPAVALTLPFERQDIYLGAFMASFLPSECCPTRRKIQRRMGRCR
eukprot:4426527-Amphidinium_carterae.1